MADKADMHPRYEVLEHTADVGLRGFGKTPEELFAAMAVGMIRLILSPDSQVSHTEERHIEVEGYDPESLMVAWLSELLFQIYSEGFLPGGIQSIKIQEPENVSADSGGYSASAVISGEKFQPETHELVLEIKGVTYHMLKVERLDESGWDLDPEAQWYAQVILDI
ncbi:MAG TPA: archease [Firmicutes bacterium]|jgi:SHS2 domain-containing protein|nr:archease [Bacillota bacterium]